MTNRILVTGFTPFGGDAANPSFEAVRLLPDKAGQYEIIREELPVLFDEAANRLLLLAEKHQPTAVLCTGLAADRAAVTPEVIAVNLRHARIPDNAGMQPVWEKIDASGPDGLFAALPVRKMTEALKAAGIPAAPSFSAGTFVCNEVMYRLLDARRKYYPEMAAGFVHVPYAEEFPHAEDASALPLEQIAQGLKICLEEIAACCAGGGFPPFL